jgi:predicted RNA-binding Zn-ribbon protein involved in translation (DUF1610 family)
LASVVFGENLVILYSAIFSNCSALKTLYIPESVEYIWQHSSTAFGFICPNCDENLIIYCGSESTKEGMNVTWNRYSGSQSYETIFNVSYEEYLEIINS